MILNSKKSEEVLTRFHLVFFVFFLLLHQDGSFLGPIGEAIVAGANVVILSILLHLQHMTAVAGISVVQLTLESFSSVSSETPISWTSAVSLVPTVVAT